MDILLSWVFAVAVFGVLSLLVGPDSRDTRRPCDMHGSWAGLTA